TCRSWPSCGGPPGDPPADGRPGDAVLLGDIPLVEVPVVVEDTRAVLVLGRQDLLDAGGDLADCGDVAEGAGERGPVGGGTTGLVPRDVAEGLGEAGVGV